MKNELVISCYNKPRHLRSVLSSLLQQSRRPDAVCFSDDGSGQETRAVIEAFVAAGHIPSRHVWQPDRGFRKCAALNQSIRSSQAEYLIFVDDDCVMHPGFMDRHVRAARPGQFLTGSVIRLDAGATRQVLDADEVAWTRDGRLLPWAAQGLSQWLKAGLAPAYFAAILERLSPVRRNWAGGHASGFRADILRVNGFDETMFYGGEDKEFGARLRNAGIRGRHVRYTAPLYHLEHDRTYADRDAIRSNRRKLETTRRKKLIWTDAGILGGAASAPEV